MQPLHTTHKKKMFKSKKITDNILELGFFMRSFPAGTYNTDLDKWH